MSFRTSPLRRKSVGSIGHDSTDGAKFLRRGEAARRRASFSAPSVRSPSAPLSAAIPERRNAWNADNIPTEVQRPMRVKTKAPLPSFLSKPHEKVSDRDFLKENQASLWKAATRNPQRDTERAKARRLAPGKLPAYLVELISKRNEEAVKAAAVAEETQVTAGLNGGRIMPENERVELLTQLRAQRRALESSFQRYTHTNPQGPRRIAFMERLGNEMDELDDMINKLSSSKVVIA